MKQQPEASYASTVKRGFGVSNCYDGHFKLTLSEANKKDLVEYLKGI